MSSKAAVSFLDTDVIIRFLTTDDLKKQQAAAVLFRKVIEGKLALKIPVTVIADAVYVLSSPRLYHLQRTKVRDLLTSLFKNANFRVDDKNALFSALDLYASSGLDFGDSYLASLIAQGEVKTIYSYDHDFDTILGVIRKQP